MSDESTILSVGIDIGTSTTQVIFGQLTFKNSAGYFAVPHISISEKKVLYKSDIYTTPLLNSSKIDGYAVRKIVEKEYRTAGYVPADIQTGAVIITGESARKENSEIVIRELSSFAGEFVVSTAGPDLESVIAGKGSGARQDSIDYQRVTINLDIGGGTTNAAVFDQGETVGKGCLDIGGRLVKYDNEGRIIYISNSVKDIAAANEITIYEGMIADYPLLYRICEVMASLLYEWISNSEDYNMKQLLHKIKTSGSTLLDLSNKEICSICFSGGVGELIYHPGHENWKTYGDIGIVLADAIRDNELFKYYYIVQAAETIRATVVGAGSYTTRVSGSTITWNTDIFPITNIPVLKLNTEEQEACFRGDTDRLMTAFKWMQDQSDSRQLILAMKGEHDPAFTKLKTLAAAVVAVLDACLPEGAPMIVVVQYDMAKALGQLMLRVPVSQHRDVICIDSIQVDQNDFVDMGKPLMDGLVIPVVIKTLIFG